MVYVGGDADSDAEAVDCARSEDNSVAVPEEEMSESAVSELDSSSDVSEYSSD